MWPSGQLCIHRLVASLGPPANTTTCHFMFEREPAMCWNMGRGRGIKGEMRSSALLCALNGKGQIVLVRNIIVLEMWECPVRRGCIWMGGLDITEP